MHPSVGLGDVFNVISSASTQVIQMDQAEAATLVAFIGNGAHSVTLSESIDGASSQSLAAIDTIWKTPGVGGAWTKVTQTAASTYAVTDATNDCIVITVFATQLSPGYNCITFTNTSSVASVYLTGLREPAAPTSLPDPT